MSTANPRFRFRRQFVMGRSLSAPIPDWQHVRFGSFDVHAHPDLIVTSVERGAIHAMLLGYAFDPDAPQRSNHDIVSGLAGEASFADLLDALAAYGGTFALLYRNGRETRLVHDTGGLYEVYYKIEGELVVGSQPAILEKCTALEKDTSKDAVKFFGSEPFRKSGYLWARETTLYRNVLHLMPNYYLDLESGAAIRYWPSKRRAENAMDPVADRVAGWLDGFFKGALSRYSLSVGVSSGLDSRVLMAASRPYRAEIAYFIVPHPGGGSIDRADRRIAPRLAKRLGVPLAFRAYGDTADPAFEKFFEESITLGRKGHMHEWYDVFYRQSREEMTINGNVSEVARLHYNRNPEPSGDDLSRIAYGAALPYTVAAYDRWLAEVRPLCERFDYDPIDLFYLEERMGNWAAKGRSEMHLVTEVFTPYNCRRLLEMLLSVDASQRAKFDNALYREIIRRLWPEALEEPINPRLKLYVSKWMRQLGVYTPIMKLLSTFQR